MFIKAFAKYTLLALYFLNIFLTGFHPCTMTPYFDVHQRSMIKNYTTVCINTLLGIF